MSDRSVAADTTKRQKTIPLAEFAPGIPASERPCIHALDRAANGIGHPVLELLLLFLNMFLSL
jgi:hypothetical protein